MGLIAHRGGPRAGALPLGTHLAGWVLTLFARTTGGGFCRIRTGLFDPCFPEILRVASCNLKGAPALISGGQKLTHSAWDFGPMVRPGELGPLVQNRDHWSEKRVRKADR